MHLSTRLKMSMSSSTNTNTKGTKDRVIPTATTANGFIPHKTRQKTVEKNPRV